jgi:hypothetical protein
VSGSSAVAWSHLAGSFQILARAGVSEVVVVDVDIDVDFDGDGNVNMAGER